MSVSATLSSSITTSDEDRIGMPSPSTQSSVTATTAISLTDFLTSGIAWVVAGLFISLTLVFATFSVTLMCVVYHAKVGAKKVDTSSSTRTNNGKYRLYRMRRTVN